MPAHYDGRVSQAVVREVQPLRRTRRDLVRIGRLVAAYVVIRLVGVWLLGAAALIPKDSPAITPESPQTTVPASDPTTYDKLGLWDGGWYVEIAENGYPDELVMVSPQQDESAPLAFPPLYPMLMRLLHLAGMPALSAGLLITAIAGVAALVGVYAVARDLVPPRAAALTALLWAAGPMTIVLSMAYSEALFIALAAWAIWLVRRGWWLTAGALALLSGLTRSTGLAVGVAVAVAAFAAWRSARPGGVSVRERGLKPARDGEPLSRGATGGDAGDGSRPDGGPRPDGGAVGPAARWRLVAASVLGLLGVPLWWAYVAIVSGRVDGWFAAQEFFWGSRFDFGESVVVSGWRMLTFQGSFPPLVRGVYTASALAMLAAGTLLVLLLAEAWRRRRDVTAGWWPVAAYAVVLVLLAVGSAGFPQSKIRFLVPMFPLLLLPGRALARSSTAAQAAVIGAAALVSGWFGGFMLSVWTYAI